MTDAITDTYGDDAYLSQNITTRYRRLFTFKTPIQLQLLLRADHPALMSVLAAEGMIDDSDLDHGQLFLVLDRLFDLDGDEVMAADLSPLVIGVWVAADNIASMQIRLVPWTTRSLKGDDDETPLSA